HFFHLWMEVSQTQAWGAWREARGPDFAKVGLGRFPVLLTAIVKGKEKGAEAGPAPNHKEGGGKRKGDWPLRAKSFSASNMAAEAHPAWPHNAFLANDRYRRRDSVRMAQCVTCHAAEKPQVLSTPNVCGSLGAG